jgi:hypothetical protein
MINAINMGDSWVTRATQQTTPVINTHVGWVFDFSHNHQF